MIKAILLEFEVRDRLGISTAEFILCSLVFMYQNSPNGIGWCIEKNGLMDGSGLSRSQFKIAISNLIEKGLLVQHSETGFLKITDKWYLKGLMNENQLDVHHN